jgi:hypothetical protein
MRTGVKCNRFRVPMLALALLIFPIFLAGCPGKKDEPGARSKAYADCLSRQSSGSGEDCSKYQSP